MFPLGHIGITVFLARFLRLNLVVVGAAALLPDLLDKPILLLTGAGYAKYFGHTLIAAVLITLLAALFRRGIAGSILFGMVMHLAEDALLAYIHGWGNIVPWLYPFKEYNLFFITDYHIREDYLGTGAVGFDILGALLLLRVAIQADAAKYISSFAKNINARKR